MVRLRSAVALFTLLPPGLSSLTPDTLQIREIYRFENGTHIENLAVRHNSHILFTTFDRGRLYNLDPGVDHPEPELVAELPQVNALTGMTDISQDVFAVIAGTRTSDSPLLVKESFKLFTVSLSAHHEQKPPIIELIASIPEAAFLNGMAHLPQQPNIILSADSINGCIFREDLGTGTRDIAIGDESLAMSTEGNKLPLGVNGIKVHESHLYFTNSARGLFGRIPIDPYNGSQTGAVEVIATLAGEGVGATIAYDDFAITSSFGGWGKAAVTAYVGTHPNSVHRIGILDGTQDVFIGGGNSTLINGPTSVAFAGHPSRKMYVATRTGQLFEIMYL